MPGRSPENRPHRDAADAGDLMAMTRAVFVDKDGTLVKNVPCNVDPTRIELTNGARKALRMLRDAGYVLVMVRNQPVAAQGRLELDALDAVEARLQLLLA